MTGPKSTWRPKIDVRVWDFEASNNETLEGDKKDQNENFEDALGSNQKSLYKELIVGLIEI